MELLEIYIDGGSRGNPGPAGIGVVMYRGGEVIKNISQFIAEATNNVAEYTSLIYGLQEALIQRAKRVKVYTDSELLFKQVKKVYKIKDAQLKALHAQAQHMISSFENFDIEYIARELNKEADKLAAKAIQQDVFNF